MVCSGFASQMVAVAVGWQVFAIHRNPFDLGLIGLAEFAPVPLLALPAGQLADRLPRATLVFVSNVAEAVVVGLLLLVTIAGAQELWQFVVLAALTGATAALGNPAARSLTPEIVPTDRRAGGDDRRSGARRPALRDPAGARLRGRRGSSRLGGAARAHRQALGHDRAREPGAAGREEPRRRCALHPRDADHPRRDHARPLRRPL